MSKKHSKHNPEEAAAATSAAPAAPGAATENAASPEAAAPPSLEELQALRAQAAQADEWKTKYLYILAELDNYRKRAIKERSELLKYAGQDVLYELLEIADNYNRALEADRNETDPRVIVDGLDIIRKQLAKLLEKFEVRPIATVGTAFDPARHEALQQVPTPDAAPGSVVVELQPGYTFRDKVLRPARVVVAAAPPEPPAA
jgi:molecular chaperone GrpE